MGAMSSTALSPEDIERRNIFENITMTDEAYDFSVSVIGNPITSREIHLTGRSRHVGGQLTSEDYQATIEAIKTVDLHYQQNAEVAKGESNRESAAQDVKEEENRESPATEGENKPEKANRFSSCYGLGHQLSSLPQEEQNQTSGSLARAM